MKCSIIISVYKNTRFLETVLASLALQTEQDFEVIVSEDGDSPEMRQFMQQQSLAQPLLHLTQADEGWRKNRALNRAIAAAHSDHLVFVDGDCVLHPRFVEMHVRHFRPDAILGGKRVMLSERLTERVIADHDAIGRLQPSIWAALLWHRGTERAEEGLFLSPDGLLAFIPRRRRLNFLTGCNMSFSRQAIERINGFDEDYVRPAYGEDADLMWRFRMAGMQFVSLRNMAVEYHLWHKKGWVDQSENRAMGEAKRQRGEYVCKNGLQKL